MHGALALTGGIESQARKRSTHTLQLSGREEISRGRDPALRTASNPPFPNYKVGSIIGGRSNNWHPAII